MFSRPLEQSVRAYLAFFNAETQLNLARFPSSDVSLNTISRILYSCLQLYRVGYILVVTVDEFLGITAGPSISNADDTESLFLLIGSPRIRDSNPVDDCVRSSLVQQLAKDSRTDRPKMILEFRSFGANYLRITT